ncbi:hypothetical protein BC833DRAFT_604491 [Globomyces pollinis-pini]|nr:hypothetical protein BC833DRAFT_604491 [Globomyces pollinis-pini]
MDPLSNPEYSQNEDSNNQIQDPLTVSSDPLSSSINEGSLLTASSMLNSAIDPTSSNPDSPLIQPTGQPLVTSSVFNLNNNSSLEGESVAKTEFCCDLDSALSTCPASNFNLALDVTIPLREQLKPAITIEDATKAHDMSGKSFTTYLIKADLNGLKFESKHRYSEFESLRVTLAQKYPSCIVPPIPEKHSIAAYAVKPKNAKDDPKIIMKRKRLLQSFLNRLASHSILKNAHEFHMFLNGEVSWNETTVLISSTNSVGLKKKSSMASLNEGRSLRKPDPYFVGVEDYSNRFAAQINFIRKVHKKIVANYSDMALIYMDLGALYNGWSLTEQNLSNSIEQMGQAVDSTLTATSTLNVLLEERFGDMLQEYSQFSKSIKKLLGHRHKCHVEFEVISETLTLKEQYLTKLESSEHESQRLAAVLSVEGQPPIPISKPQGIIAQLNALIDNDPEATRRNTISKTKDLITSLENDRETSRLALIELNSEIQRELTRFQNQKLLDLRQMFICYCMAMKEYHSKSLESWLEVKQVVDQIEL